MKHVVIGTAGHVDHGKTALVKALTGTDTDRLPEEQKRGITIDIGFAALDLDPNISASIVDVPGHEDFVRNMVAGSTGVDVALLVVAADEGVMPQTVEHLAILRLLDIKSGVVAITKADLAEPEWLELVRADVSELVSRTEIQWEPPVAVSALRQTGLSELRAALARAATRARDRSLSDLFRLPVDRVFTVPGTGTVVTGTTWSGTVAVGEQVTVLPQGITARIRGVEVHDHKRDRAEPGRRTALALAGIDRKDLERGSVVVADPSWRATQAVDATVTLLDDAPRPLTQRSRVRFHLGTAEVMARVTPAGREIGPGETGVVRFRLEAPVVARWGDRIIVRAYSPVTTIGGATVTDQWPAARPRRPPVDPRRGSSIETDRIASLAGAAGVQGLAIADLPVRAGLEPSRVERLVTAMESARAVMRADGLLAPVVAVEQIRVRTLALLERYHVEHPLEPGLSLEALRKATGANAMAAKVHAELVDQGAIALEAGIARLRTHQPRIAPALEETGRMLLEGLAAAGPEGRTVGELSATLEVGTILQLLDYYVRQGTAVRVGSDRYYDRGSLDRLARAALQQIQSGQDTPAQLRDAIGLTRKFLIPLLEWLDQQGFTIRGGEGRRLTRAGERYLSNTAVP